MNRLILVVVLAIGMVAAGVVTWFMTRPAPPAGRAPAAAARPASRPAEPPVARETAPPPPPASEPSTARRSPAKKALPAAPAPAPAAVEAAPDTATLNITSDVPGAEVFIDRQFIGATPIVAPNIKPGTHRINVSAKGYEGYAETIDLAAGPRDLVVNFKTVRLDAAIDVVHKHRFGSCKGRLVATAEGVRYETADKDDGFSAALVDLESFQVDYLEKNLRLQIRKGKRYDFTDPDGNADRLFVFHRDVEKVRERLKK